MRHAPPTLALAVGALALLASSCSSSSDTGSATTAGSTSSAAATTAGAATSAGSATSGGATTAGGSSGSATSAAASTEPLPTTTSIPASALEPCPVDALASATSPVTVTMWHAMSADLEKALQGLVATYNASQSKVKVQLVAQGGYDDNFDKYRTASGSDRPTIVQLPETYLQTMVDSKTAIPVQSCINADPTFKVADLQERAATAYTLESALETLPFNVSNPVLYFNKAMFTKAGLDPSKPPATLEELRQAAQAIVSSGAAKYGLAVDTGTDSGGGWYVEQWLAKADKPYADNGNGRAGRATKVEFDTPATAQVLGFLAQMVKDGLAVNVGENPSGTADLLKMADATEPAAMTIHTSAALGSVLNILKGGSIKGFNPDDLGIGLLPGPTSGGVGIGGATLWLVKGKSPEETAAAWDFAKFLVSPQSQSTWAAATGYVPVSKGATALDPIKAIYTSDPRFKVAADQLTTGQTSVNTAFPVLGPLRQVRQSTAKAVQAAFGGADPAAALATAAQEANQLLTDYNRRVGAN